MLCKIDLYSAVKSFTGYRGASRMVKDRLNYHRSDIRLKKSMTISLHFIEPGHFIEDFKITPLHSSEFNIPN